MTYSPSPLPALLMGVLTMNGRGQDGLRCHSEGLGAPKLRRRSIDTKDALAKSVLGLTSLA